MAMIGGSKDQNVQYIDGVGRLPCGKDAEGQTSAEDQQQRGGGEKPLNFRIHNNPPKN